MFIFYYDFCFSGVKLKQFWEQKKGDTLLEWIPVTNKHSFIHSFQVWGVTGEFEMLNINFKMTIIISESLGSHSRRLNDFK